MTLSDNTLQDYPTKFELELTESTINNPETAFMIEDVPESQTSHIYKLNLALSAIEDYYKSLSNETRQNIVIEESKKVKLML